MSASSTKAADHINVIAPATRGSVTRLRTDQRKPWSGAAQCFAGSVAIALITYVCFKFQLSIPTPTFLYLIVTVVVSLQGSFLLSAVFSFLAVGCLTYFFIPPIFSFKVAKPTDMVALAAFLTTSAIITRLVSRVRVLMDEKLRRSAAYLSEAQQISHTGSFGWKVRTGELSWSDETYRIFQYLPGIQPTLDLLLQRVAPEDLPLVKDLIQRASQDGKDWELEHRLLMPDGAGKHVYVVARSARDETGGLEYIGAIMDVTEPHRAQEALRNAQANLAHVARLTTVGELTASIAHEVNQPLAAVVTNANACLRWLDHQPPNVEEVRDSVRRIIRDGNRGSDVIARIRALLKKDQPPRAPLNVNEVVQETVALLRADLQGASLRTELAGQLPAVTADRVQLQQVLLNLAMNAVDAMKPVTDRPRVLLILTKRHEGQAVLVAVQDSGVGLSPKATARLFETFYTTKPDGLGMGLSICRSIVEGHGGRLWAEANPGSGATFQFTLPIESSAPA
jgi:C4-dicarboxylate-specific signal transduction histidine kinase